MKKFNILMAATVLGWMGVSASAAHAGNYQPTNRNAASSQSAQGVTSGTPSQKSQAGSKTAFFYDCYGPVCGPVTQCGSYYSPCGTRPYFPASVGYGGYGNGYGNYGGYGYGGYGSGFGGYGGGYGGYGGGLGGYGGYGGGYGGYGGGMGGYGAYSSPSYIAPMNQGMGSYGAPLMNGPVLNPGLSNPYLAPVNGGYGGYGPGISPISQPGFGSPMISQPILQDPGFNSPFYP